MASCNLTYGSSKARIPQRPQRITVRRIQLTLPKLNWRVFTDPDLIALIDTALRNNQELNILMQEINMANNEIMARRGVLPFVTAGGSAGVDRVARYTRSGTVGANNDIKWRAKNFWSIARLLCWASMRGGRLTFGTNFTMPRRLRLCDTCQPWRAEILPSHKWLPKSLMPTMNCWHSTMSCWSSNRT